MICNLIFQKLVGSRKIQWDGEAIARFFLEAPDDIQANI